MKRPLFPKVLNRHSRQTIQKNIPTKLVHKITWKYTKKSKDISPKRPWRTISTKRTLKTSPHENEKKHFHQRNDWKTCSPTNPWGNNSTKIICTQKRCQEKFLPKKMWRNISKESLYRNLHWEKGTFFTPKNQAESLSQRRRTCTKNQKMLKKIPQQKLSTKKLWRVPAKKYQKRNLYQRYFGRDIPTPRKYSIWREISTKEKKKALQKKQIKNYLAKKLGRETFAFFQEKSLRNKMWRDIRTSKFVKRNLYQKMFEETFLPKSLKRHLQQRIWEGKSIAKNLSRTNPRNLWKEISTKTTLQRHLQNFSQEKFLPNKHLRGFFH